MPGQRVRKGKPATNVQETSQSPSAQLRGEEGAAILNSTLKATSSKAPDPADGAATLPRLKRRGRPRRDGQQSTANANTSAKRSRPTDDSPDAEPAPKRYQTRQTGVKEKQATDSAPSSNQQKSDSTQVSSKSKQRQTGRREKLDPPTNGKLPSIALRRSVSQPNRNQEADGTNAGTDQSAAEASQCSANDERATPNENLESDEEDNDNADSDADGKKQSTDDIAATFLRDLFQVGPRDWRGNGSQLRKAASIGNDILGYKTKPKKNVEGLCAKLDGLKKFLKTTLAQSVHENGLETLPASHGKRLVSIVDYVDKLTSESQDDLDEAKASSVAIYGCVLPRCALTLYLLLGCFGATPELTVAQFSTSIKLMRTMLDLQEYVDGLRRQHNNFVLDIPILKRIEQLCSNIKPAHKEFTFRLQRLQREADLEIQCRRDHEREVMRENAEKAAAAREATFSKWRREWQNLHVIRRGVEFRGRARPDVWMLKHLRDIPIEDVAIERPALDRQPRPTGSRKGNTARPSTPTNNEATTSRIEHDANGTPFERESVFSPRPGHPPQAGRPAPPERGNFTSEEDVALLRVLESAAGPDVWSVVIARLCQRVRTPKGGLEEAALGTRNVSEIVERGIWLRDVTVWLDEVDERKEVDGRWTARVRDPRIRPIVSPVEEETEEVLDENAESG